MQDQLDRILTLCIHSKFLVTWTMLWARVWFRSDWISVTIELFHIQSLLRLQLTGAQNGIYTFLIITNYCFRLEMSDLDVGTMGYLCRDNTLSCLNPAWVWLQLCHWWGRGDWWQRGGLHTWAQLWAPPPCLLFLSMWSGRSLPCPPRRRRGCLSGSRYQMIASYQQRSVWIEYSMLSF